MIIGLIISITIAVTFIILYVASVQDYASLKKDNEWQNRDYDSRPLNKETLMEAIRYNGYIPVEDGKWVTFMVQGEQFSVDTERLPILWMIKTYCLDRSAYDMDIMHQAAHRVSDELCMGKVLFYGKDEDRISFQFATIEKTFGQFRDKLSWFIAIISEAQNTMGQRYEEMKQAASCSENANGDSKFTLPSYAKGWDA